MIEKLESLNFSIFKSVNEDEKNSSYRQLR
jgi:hypothetical protein